ncbi:hypothetical protein PN498_13190 [Oscillatoria sp. CS-180]|uniref:DUF6753 family protein n=1 Tax=Oscillatoria sp. CS-180 TaxID=3021720 RepID=UPI00232BEA45|nr:DUF6753 family protein [Oscillatoria sp. CS-180]MDB9526948.1 hypothetical protein [Oscillatoria sp. CS-180]
MTQPNSPGPLSQKAQSLLDQALAGESDRVKSRVLQLVLDAGIDPEEEFFLISVGLNHVKVLLEDAPQQLNSWSELLVKELNLWSDSYSETLQLIAEKAQATNALLETAGQLATFLTSHTQTCNALVRQLQSAHNVWGNSWEEQTEVNTALMDALTALPETLRQQTVQLKALTAEVQSARKPDPLQALGLRSNSNQHVLLYGLVGSIGILAAGLIAFLGLYIHDRDLVRSTKTKVEYLFQEQN